jgi:hypothetical protein
MSIFYSGLNTYTTSNLTNVNISTANISNIQFTTISNTGIIITNSLIDASNVSITNASIERLNFGTMFNGKTHITGSLINASNASIGILNFGTIANGRTNITGSLINASNASFTNVSIERLDFGTIANGRTNITGSLINASNASFTNVSIERLDFGTIANGRTNITGSLINSLNASFTNISASNIYTELLDTTSNLIIGPTSKEMTLGTSNLNLSTTTIVGATAEGLGNTCAVNGDGTRVVIGSSNFNSGRGRFQVYHYINRNWTSTYSQDGTTGEGLGNSCAFNKEGNILAVGSSIFDSNKGKIQIFQYTTSWINVVTLFGTNSIGSLIGERLGSSCAFNAAGNILAVGSAYYSLESNPDKGRIQIFRYNTTNWTNTNTSSIVGEFNGENLGNSCALNDAGDILAVGSIITLTNTSANGKLQIFQYVNPTWINMSTILGENTEKLGNSCAFNAAGNILLVASPNFSSNNISRGKLQILQYNTSWSNSSTIFGETAEQLGSACALNDAGDILAVGSSNFDSNRGKLQIFKYNTKWENISTIVGENIEQLGNSCALNDLGNTLAIGSSNFDSNRGKLQIIQTTMINMYTQNTINIGAYSVNMNYPGSVLNTTTFNASNASIGRLNFGTIFNGNTNITGSLINASNASFTNVSIGRLVFGTMINGNTNITGSLINASNASFTNASFERASFTNISTSNIYTVLLDTPSNLTIGPSSNQMIVGNSNLNISNTSILGSTAERLGFSCAINGDGTILAIGSNNFDSGRGRIQIFKYNNVSWTNMSTINSTTIEGFGNCCALNTSGDILVVGASNFSSNNISRGRIQIFKYNVSWISAAQPITGDTPIYGGAAQFTGQTVGEQLGSSCALNATGNILAIGAFNYNTSTQLSVYKGKIQIITFNINPTTITTASNTSIVADFGEQLGSSCALNAAGNILAAGSLNSTNGKIQIFQYNDTNWINVATIIGTNGEKLGSSCSLNAIGNILAVGSSNFSSSRGKIQIVQYNTTNIPWVITNNVSVIGDTIENLGNACALNSAGNVLAVGSSNFSSNNISNTGKIQIFQYNTNLINISTILGETAEQFGSSCALNASGNILAIGSSNFNSGFGKLHTYFTTMINMYTQNSINIGAYSVNLNYPGSALNVSGPITANGGITSSGTINANILNSNTLYPFAPAVFYLGASNATTIQIGGAGVTTSNTVYGVINAINGIATNQIVPYSGSIINLYASTYNFYSGTPASSGNSATLNTGTIIANALTSNAGISVTSGGISVTSGGISASGQAVTTGTIGANGLITASAGITIPSPQTLSVNTITNSTLEIGRSSSTSKTWYEIVSDQTNLFIDYHNNIITTCDYDARIMVSQANTSTAGTATITYFAGLHNFNNQVQATIFNSTSDIRSKNVIRYITLEETLNFINNTNPILFTWKNDTNEINKLNSGYIAQEVMKTTNHLVHTSKNDEMKESCDGPEGKQYVLNYDGIIPYHGVAIKHLLQENNELKEQMNELKQHINDLSTKNNELLAEINKIKEFIKFNS